MNPERNRERRALIPLAIILVVSLGLKLLLFFSVPGPTLFMTNDSPTYLTPAKTLVETGSYTDTLRTPGYPIFIALVYRVAGPRPAAVVVAQIVLSLGTLMIAYGLAAELFDRRVALAAVLLMALDLASFVYSLWLLTETLFTLLLTAAVYGAVRFHKASRLGWSLFCGISFAASVLVRPIAYYLAAGWVVWMIFVGIRRRFGWRHATAAAVVFLVPFLLAVGGWQWRNHQLTGVATLSRVDGINMLFFRGAAVLALRDGIDFEEARRRLGYKRYTELHPEATRLSPDELSARWHREGLALIRAHPVLFARTMIPPLAAILLATPEHSLMKMLGIPLPATGPLGDLARLDLGAYAERWILGRTASWLAFVLLLSYLLILYLGAGLAWMHLIRNGSADLAHGVLVLVFLYMMLISAGPEAYSRFRVPLTPLLCVYAAAGLRGARRKGDTFSAVGQGDERT